MECAECGGGGGGGWGGRAVCGVFEEGFGARLWGVVGAGVRWGLQVMVGWLEGVGGCIIGVLDTWGLREWFGGL